MSQGTRVHTYRKVSDCYGVVISMENVLIHREPGKTDEDTTTGMALHTACTVLSTRVRNGGERSSAGTRTYNRRRRVRLHIVVCRYADRRGPCHRDGGGDWYG
jgi:hypothetical protein